MRRIALFVEDQAHRLFLETLINRLAREQHVDVHCDWRNARRGHGAVIRELKQYLRDLFRGRNHQPDVIVIATDANCKGLNQRTREIDDVTRIVPARIICAVPDPHIERWLLLDSSAFKQVVGRGCDAPDQKCQRSRYKKMLSDNIRQADITPSLGGIEFAADIVETMDLEGVARQDASFGRFYSEIKNLFQEWQHV